MSLGPGSGPELRARTPDLLAGGPEGIHTARARKAAGPVQAPASYVSILARPFGRARELHNTIT